MSQLCAHMFLKTENFYTLTTFRSLIGYKFCVLSNLIKILMTEISPKIERH